MSTWMILRIARVADVVTPTTQARAQLAADAAAAACHGHHATPSFALAPAIGRGRAGAARRRGRGAGDAADATCDRHLLRGSATAAALARRWLAAPADAASLRDALVTTYLTSPHLEAGRSELRQVDELVPQALSGYRPSLFLDSDVDRRDEHDPPGRRRHPAEPHRPSSVSLTLRQNLYAGGGTQAQVSQAENQVRAQRARLYALEQQVLLDAVDAYTAAFRDQVGAGSGPQQRGAAAAAARGDPRPVRGRRGGAHRRRPGRGAPVARPGRRRAGQGRPRQLARLLRAGGRRGAEQARGAQGPAASCPRPRPRRAPSPRRTRTSSPRRSISTPPATMSTSQFSDLLPSLDLQGELAYADQPTANIEWGRTARRSASTCRSRSTRAAASTRGCARAASGCASSATSSETRPSQRPGAGDLLLGAAAGRHGRDRRLQGRGARQPDRARGRRSRRRWSARAPCSTCSTPSRSCSPRRSTWSARRREEILASYQLKLAVGQLTVEGLELPVEPFDAVAYYERNRTRLFGVAD